MNSAEGRDKARQSPLDVRLAQFEGPLDLLLHLIEKAEIDIAEIFVSDITAQYLELMQQADGLDMERASSFLQMAANLLYIKSRALLPQTRRHSDEEEMDPEAALIRQIHEYKACKEAAEELLLRHELASKVYARLPEEYPLPPPKVLLTDLPIDRLYDAFMGVLLREAAEEKRAAERRIQRDAYSIGDQMTLIQRGIAPKEKRHLHEFFPADGGRLGIIVTFMALLELMNQKVIVARQEREFATIVIEMTENAVYAV